jgi:hypothetical protein
MIKITELELELEPEPLELLEPTQSHQNIAASLLKLWFLCSTVTSYYQN